jgi:hypothetical protein
MTVLQSHCTSDIVVIVCTWRIVRARRALSTGERMVSLIDALHPAWKRLLLTGKLPAEEDSLVAPWRFLGPTELYDAKERWPDLEGRAPLVVFAVKYDCDDIAYFASNACPLPVVRLEWRHNGTGGAEVIAKYASVWEWAQSLVADVRFNWEGYTEEPVPE